MVKNSEEILYLIYYIRRRTLKFSIIIPCYNVEPYIEKTLESIIKQSYSNIQVILINDGSTDNTLEILEKYVKKDARFEVISQENRGVSEARNRGLEKVKGDYVYFLDGDDIIEIELFKNAAKILEEQKVEMFVFGYDLKCGNKKKSYSNKKYDKIKFSSIEFLKLFLKTKIRYNISSFIIHKRRIMDLEFNKGLSIGEDIEYQLKILMKETFFIFYSSDIYFHYLKRRNSATTKKEFDINEISELEYLENLRSEMLIRGIEEYKCYQIVSFFYFIKNTSNKKISKANYKILQYNLEQYSYILKDLRINFNRKLILLNVLKIIYKLNFKLFFYLNKLVNVRW